MLFWIIYHMPLWMPIAITVVAVLVYPAAMLKIKKKNSTAVKWISRSLSVIAIFGILAITIINRSGDCNEVVLMPFHSFIEAKEQDEIYRSMLMNIFLFVPFGICMPYSMGKLKANAVAVTVIIALFLSVGIEAFQLIFSFGRCETDDVICNTFGAVVGALNYFIFLKIGRNKE